MIICFLLYEEKTANIDSKNHVEWLKIVTQNGLLRVQDGAGGGPVNAGAWEGEGSGAGDVGKEKEEEICKAKEARVHSAVEEGKAGGETETEGIWVRYRLLMVTMVVWNNYYPTVKKDE